jgi:CheY-like chemotaxis protein
MSIPIFQFPSTIVHVDDNSLTLKTVKMALGEVNHIVSIQDPQDFIKYLDNYISPLSQINFLRNIEDSEKFGLANHAPVDLEISKLSNLVNNKDKYKEISLLIIDYEMPMTNGIELCEKLKKFPAKKILLTAHADYRRANEAHNNQLIDRFVIKDEPNAMNDLIMMANQLIIEYFIEKTGALTNHLSINTLMPFKNEAFGALFKQIIADYKIQEYYIIDKNGSYLLITNENHKCYLIIHTENSLDYFIDLYNDELPLRFEDQLDQIIVREKIPYFGLNKTFDDIDPNDLDKYLFTPNILLNGTTKYYWCIINSLN